MQRDHRFDNIKFLLIFLVVFGHLLELISGSFSHSLYMVIYSFHMPAFIFVSGYFAKFKPRKILLKLVWVYVLFQVLYLLFDSALYGSPVNIQFTTPYWLMWYMLVMVFCYCLIPLIDVRSTKARILILGLAVVASVVAGFDDNIGRFLSLSRFFTFLPYFLAGFYLGKSKTALWDIGLIAKRRGAVIAVLAVLIIASAVCVLNVPAITANVLYGVSPYGASAYGPGIKLLLIAIAACWIFFILMIAPAKRIALLSTCGANTLSIYILHGFIVRFLGTTELFAFDQAINLLVALAISIALVLVLGSKPVARAFNMCCTGEWVEYLLKRRARD